jgi:hypothetical protein
MNAVRIESDQILTVSGVYVNPLDLRPNQIHIVDVAHALAHQCRFVGHTNKFYSVAEHSVRALRWNRKRNVSHAELQWTLLHDASEAYLVDLARPMKIDPYFGKAYRGAEGRAMEVICERFGLDRKEPACVKEADLAMLAAERRDLMPAGGDWVILEGVEAPTEVISPWSPRRAKRMFLQEYVRLFGVVVDGEEYE